MPAEAGDTFAIHATAVAIGDRALLIRGASRAGKSRLALALTAHTTPALPIRIVGDDRILLDRVSDGLLVRPHPRIAGFIECRGLGIVAVPWVAQALVGAVVELRASGPSLQASHQGIDHIFEGIPGLVLDRAANPDCAGRVLTWWASLTAARASHSPGKAGRMHRMCAKD